MTTYEPDEIVDITIRGARVLNHGADVLAYEYPVIDGEAGVGARAEVMPGADCVTVTRVIPAAGMPKPGELWEDAEGTRYVAATYCGEVRLISGRPGIGPGGERVDLVHRIHGPIKPVYQDPPDDTAGGVA